MARLEGRLEEAKEIYEQELTLLEKSGDRLAQAISFHNLGHTLLGLGARQQAAACFKESLARYRQLENERGIALCLAGMGGVAALSGRGEQAARLLARAEATLAAGHFPLPMGPADQSAFERYLAAVKAQIDHPAFAAAWEVGEQMTLNQAIAYGLEVIGHE
jgi:tetratricopeptide (TPR) repeat protein